MIQTVHTQIHHHQHHIPIPTSIQLTKSSEKKQLCKEQKCVSVHSIHTSSLIHEQAHSRRANQNKIHFLNQSQPLIHKITRMTKWILSKFINNPLIFPSISSLTHPYINTLTLTQLSSTITILNHCTQKSQVLYTKISQNVTLLRASHRSSEVVELDPSHAQEQHTTHKLEQREGKNMRNKGRRKTKQKEKELTLAEEDDWVSP